MSDKEDKELLKKLNSNDSTEIYGALIKIRKYYVRNYDKMRRLSKSSVIKIIISFIEHPKFCNISLSIIADACLEKELIFEVIQNNGIKSLIRIMEGLVNDDVKNRACRALGNIAKSKAGFEAIHTMNPVSNIIKFLMGNTNKNCQQTAVRTLRILGKDSKSRDIIVRENGVIYIAQLLHSNSKEVIMCSTRALAELTENCSIGCARQMLEMNSLKMLVQLYSHSDRNIKMHALISLKNLSALDEVRSDLIKVGAVKLFTEVAMNCGLSEMSRLATLALCCCVDRLHMWGNYGVSKCIGLKAILEILRRSAFEDIHIHIIAALIPLCYEQGVPDTLFELEIIQILIQNLKYFIAHNKKEHSDPISQALDLNSDVVTVPSPKEMEAACEEELSRSSIPSLSSEEDELLLKEKYFKDSPFSSEITYSSASNFPFVQSENNFYPVKNIPKYNYSSYLHLHSSGASSNCSPSSSGSNNAVSPNLSSDSNPCSPLADPWSPQSNSDETVLCWSPVHSDASDIVIDIVLEKIMESQKTSPIHIIDVPDKNTGSVTKHPASALSKNFSTLSSNYTHNPDISPISAYKEKVELNTDAEKTEENILILHHKDKESPNSRKHKAYPKLFLEDSPGNKKLKISSQCSKSMQKIEFPSEKWTMDHCVLALLTQLSFHLDKKTNSEIAGRGCFSVLIDYMVSIQNPNPKAEKILLSLVRNRYCFEKLIMSGFVTEMERKMTVMHDPKICIRCLQINNSYLSLLSALKPEAESDYGVGTLCHILSTSEEPSQLYAIHAISKLIVIKSALFKLIIQGNGLSIIFKFLSGTSEIVSSTAILSLCQLYQNLRKTKTSDIFDKCCFTKTCKLNVTSKCAYRDAVLDVTFCVNGMKVLASRETICHNSEYFRALLEGHFSEKQKDVVTMPDISAETLTSIFHFLHGCQTENICPFIKRIPFAILLESLSECEKFLLFDAKVFIVDRLCHNLFPNTISKIYQAAKSFNSSVLYQKALHILLCMGISQKNILLKCFKELVSLEDFNVLNDIKLLIQNIFSERIYKCSNEK